MPKLSWDDSFSVAVPDGFSFQLFSFQSETEEKMIVDPRMMQGGASFRPNVVIGRPGHKSTALSLPSYVEAQVKQFHELPAYKLRAHEPVRLSNGDMGVIVEHSFQNREGARVAQMQLYALHQGEVVLISATSLEGVPYESKREGYRTMLLSAAVQG